LDYPAAVSIGTADRGIHDPELDDKITANINDIVKGMFPDDVREWELFYTNHQGDFTQVAVDAVLRLIANAARDKQHGVRLFISIREVVSGALEGSHDQLGVQLVHLATKDLEQDLGTPGDSTGRR